MVNLSGFESVDISSFLWFKMNRLNFKLHSRKWRNNWIIRSQAKNMSHLYPKTTKNKNHFRDLAEEKHHRIIQEVISWQTENSWSPSLNIGQLTGQNCVSFWQTLSFAVDSMLSCLFQFSGFSEESIALHNLSTLKSLLQFYGHHHELVYLFCISVSQLL